MKKYIYSFVFIFAFLFLFGNVISFANEDLDIHKKKEYIVSYDLNLKKEKMNKNVLKKKNENIRKKIIKDLEKLGVSVKVEFEYLPYFKVEMTEQQKDNLVDMKFKGVKIAEDKLIQIDDSGLFDNYDEYMVNLDNINHNYHEFIGIDDLWEQGFKGENVRVAVLDTGASEHIEYDNVVSHKYFEGWEDYTDSDVKHGTHVLGIMAASNQNDKVVGIAPKSNYVSGKVMADYDKDHEKYHKISWDLKGLEYVIANDFKVVNMSYGGARLNERIEKIENSNKTDEEKQIEIDKLYQLFGDYNDIFQPAYFIANENLGIILIAAAGNDGYNKMEDTVDYPAAHENVIAVSNSFKKNSDGKIYLHPSSSKGPSVELTAPGTDILSTVPNNEYDRLTGTSMASPIVSGVATLLREKYPELSAQQIRKIMQLQALPVEGYILSSDGTKTNTIEKNYEFGYGLVQAETGMKINSKIYLGTPREGYYFPNNQEFKTGQMIEPGTYDVVRMNNDKTWFEIKIADKKYRWVNADIFDVSLGYQVTTYETENKFSKIDGEIVGTVSPRTYEVVQRNNEWFQIRTLSLDGSFLLEWIKPVRYTTNTGIYKISLNDGKTELFNSTNITDTTGKHLSPQVVTVMERKGDWFRILTSLGSNWIKPVNYYNGFRITLNDAKTQLYNAPSLSKPNNANPIDPQTVIAVEQDDEWFLINTSLGLKWVKPTNYYLGNFNLTLHDSSTKLYNQRDLNSFTGSSVSPQTVSATEKYGNWFLINTGIGPKWVNPSKYSVGNFSVTIHETSSTYDYMGGSVVGSIVPGTVTITNRIGDWYQLGSVAPGKWIKIYNYDLGKFKVHLATDYYGYVTPGMTDKPSTIVPRRSYDATFRRDNWIEIDDEYDELIGKYWVKLDEPYLPRFPNVSHDFYINTFNIKLNESVQMYNSINYDDKVPGGLISPQMVQGVYMFPSPYGGASVFLVKTWLGEKWILPRREQFSIYK